MKVIDFTRGLLSRVYQSCTSGPGSFFTEKKNKIQNKYIYLEIVNLFKEIVMIAV